MKNNIFFKDLSKSQVVLVYGESDLNFFSFLKKWLQENKERKIVFLEDDYKKYEKSKEIIEKNFESKNIKNLLIQDNLEEFLKEIAWECSYLDSKVIKSQIEKRSDIFYKIEKLFNELHLGINITSYLYADFGIKIFENVYNNLLIADNFILFESLANKFKNIPAIISGAGPSLDKNIHLLKNFYDKALIFVGGSALNIFSKYNIKHHFSGFIDPCHLFKRFKNNYFFEDTFFYTNQMSHHNLSIVHSNKVLVSDYGAFPLKRWIYDQLNIKQAVFEAGFNVTTFLIKVAAFLGCNPIYFVGLDLCFKKNKYAKGVTKTANTYEHVKIKNIDNETVYTQKDWILAKKWIENFALTNKDIKFINIIDGGLKLENVSNVKLPDIKDSLKRNFDLAGYVHSIYHNLEKIKLNKEKIIEILEIIKKSFERAELLCDDYLSKIMNNDIDENMLKFQNEIVYIHLLDPLWQIWKYVILRKVESETVHILINKLIFFKNVISSHLKILGSIL
jgi:hypothetical protein